MTAEEFERFTTVMVYKAALRYGFVAGRYRWTPDDAERDFRRMLESVILDTSLLLSGTVSLEKWEKLLEETGT